MQKSMCFLLLFFFTMVAFSQESVSMSTNAFQQRSQDWRNNQIVYQIFVDRYARSDRFEKEVSKMFTPPRVLKNWEDRPEVGHNAPEHGCWSHELEFWGGDLRGVIQHLDYIQSLGVNVVYLNPIFDALSNHKYDATDYFTIDPQFGTWEDLQKLSDELHTRGMKLILDGVFNHVGKRSPWFIKAQENVMPYRDYFHFGSQYRHGYRAWANVGNLPELNLENPEVQNILFGDKDSVVQKYLKCADGWRLDVAFELGPKYLKMITDAAHQAKPGSLVTGEIWSYPDGWCKVLDGTMNFPLRHFVLEMVNGKLSPDLAGRFIEKTVQDCGIESILKCWTILSNHDTPRLTHLVPNAELRTMALVLHFTLPGSPVVYYGEELGMDGSGDPRNRGAMEWGRNTEDNKELQLYKQLIALRQKYPSLQYGDFVRLEGDNLLAFARITDKIRDMVIIVANPQHFNVKSTLMIPDHRIMNWGCLQDVFTGKEFRTFCGTVSVEVPPRSFYVLRVVTEPDEGGYTPYKRID